MKIIDTHAHVADQTLFPEYFLEGVLNELKESLLDMTDFPDSSTLIYRLIKKNLSDVDCTNLLAQMDEAGIDKSILLIADFGYGQDESKVALSTLYDSYYKILQKYPKRFIVFGGTDPRRGKEAIDLFEKGIVKYGFQGLKLYPPCGYELNNRGLYPYFELCKQYNLSVLTHTGPSLKSMTIDQEYPQSVQEIATDFKDVNFILGHAAFQRFEINHGLALKHGNLFLETSGFQKSLSDKWFLKTILLKLMKSIPYQVVYGSDWPMFNMAGSQKRWVEFFRNMNVLSKEQEKLFFRDNALRALKMEQKIN